MNQIQYTILLILIFISTLFSQCDNSSVADYNNDNILDILDMVVLVDQIMNDIQDIENSDISLDGVVDIIDIIKNGYPPEKIVIGMESGQFDETTFKNALENVKEIKKVYPTFGGVYDWEYLNAPPDTKDPSQWAKLMKNI